MGRRSVSRQDVERSLERLQRSAAEFISGMSQSPRKRTAKFSWTVHRGY